MKYKADYTANTRAVEERKRVRQIDISLAKIHWLALLMDMTTEDDVKTEALRMTYPVVRPKGWLWDDEEIKWGLTRSSSSRMFEHDLYTLTVVTSGKKVIRKNPEPFLRETEDETLSD